MSIKHIASTLVFSSAALLFAEEPATPPKSENTPPKTEPAPAPEEAPKAKGNLLETMAAAGRYKTFLGLLEAAGMNEDFRAVGQLTVFAPTDEALAKHGNLDAYKSDVRAVRNILDNHLVGGAFTVSQLLKTRTLTTRSGLIWTVDPSGLKIHDGNIVQPDLEATNGVVQGIDSVLLVSREVARETIRETTDDVTLRQIERKVERDAKNTGDTIYGGLKDGTDKTYDGLKSGTNKVKKFFTGD